MNAFQFFRSLDILHLRQFFRKTSNLNEHEIRSKYLIRYRCRIHQLRYFLTFHISNSLVTILVSERWYRWEPKKSFRDTSSRRHFSLQIFERNLCLSSPSPVALPMIPFVSLLLFKHSFSESRFDQSACRWFYDKDWMFPMCLSFSLLRILHRARPPFTCRPSVLARFTVAIFWVFLRQLFDFRPSVQDDRDLNHAYSLASTSDTYGPYNCCRNKDLWSVHVIVEITRDSFNTFMKKIIDILAFEIYADSDDELIATCHNLMWIVKCAPCHVMILEVNSGRGSSWWKSPDVGCHQVLSRRLRWQTSTAHEYRSCYVFYMTGTRHEWHLCPLLISRSMDLRIHVDPRFELWRWIRLSLTSLSLHCSMFETSSWHYLWGLVGWTRVSSTDVIFRVEYHIFQVVFLTCKTRLSCNFF